jgi:type IV secretion system protein VirD4
MQILIDLIEFIFRLIEGSIKFLFEFGETAISGIPKKGKDFTADFASQGTLLSSEYKGFCLTGRRNLSVKNSYQNAMVLGGTGTGKSSIVLVPSLYSMQGNSCIINDPSGELFTKTSGYLSQNGYEVKVLHFSDPSISSGYNPMTRAKTSSDIQKVSNMIITTAMGAQSKDPFWNTQGIALNAMLISILKTQDEQYQTFYNVRRLLNALGGSPESVDSLFSRYADDDLFAEYKSFLAYDNKVIQSIIATCKASLQIFMDEKVAKVTSSDSINFEDFRKKPTILFIQNSVADQKYYSVLTSLFFEQLFSYLMSRFPEKNEREIFLLIDEASSLNLPTLQLAVANVRKHRAGIMLLLQDFNQLVHNYGKNQADAIRANCFAKMYFTGQSLETAKELEQTLGKFQYLDQKGSKVIRSLMTNDEIRTMKPNTALLICGHHRPILARLRPYYKRRKYLNYSQIPTPELQSDILFDEIPKLSLMRKVEDEAA